MIKRNIDIPKKQISEFCRRWRISEFALFGSVLHDDFDSNSDVDILATFAPGADWSLLDHLQMEQELADLLDRKIDLFSKRAVEQSHNLIRRREILSGLWLVMKQLFWILPEQLIWLSSSNRAWIKKLSSKTSKYSLPFCIN